MTDAFSAMEYPHWLIVAGVVLLVLGFMGLALRRSVAQADLKEVASGDEQVRSESKSEPAQTHSANGKATPEEQKRDRWANKDRGTAKPLDDRPQVADKASK